MASTNNVPEACPASEAITSTMDAQRKRASALLTEATSSEIAIALEGLLFHAHRESYSKAVRRVVAAARRAPPATTDDKALRAFVEVALAPPMAALGRREARTVRVVRASDNGGAPSRLEPPLPDDKDRLAIYIPNLLEEARCQELIERTEQVGYAVAMMSLAGGGQVHRPDIRDNERVILWDDGIADRLWQRLQEHVPGSVDGTAAVGLSEKLRFYKYTPGQSFAKHVDDPTVLDGQQSRFSVLVYLNEGFAGGHTRLCVFDDRFVERAIDVQPSTGAAFVFDHKLLHAGMPVTDGVKYVLRTDVLYSVR